MIEYFSANLWQLWAIIAIVCLILELFSGDFFILCFSIGALAACLLSVTPATFTWQVVTFAVVSVLCLLFVRPVAFRYFHRNDPDRPSNADALVGREGTVSQTIEPGQHGRVAIDGDDWKAVAADSSLRIDQGTRVRVTALESIIITVEPV